MVKKQVTIKDVAKVAGVSVTTVSRVINNSDHPVSQSTREKVEKVVKDLNFQPNSIAQNLINNKSRMIGVIVHDVSDPYFAQIVKGIEEVTFKHNYMVAVYNTYREVDKELKAVNMLNKNRADAVILTGGSLIDEEYQKQMKEYINQLKGRGSIVMGVTEHPFEIENVYISNTCATRRMTEYILENGHKNIAYVNGPEILRTSHKRYSGYKEALNQKGIKVNEKYIVEGDFTFEGGRKAALELLQYKDEIDAVVAANDEMALGLIWEFNNQGVAIPEEISVGSIGNIPNAKYSNPPLTTIGLPIYKVGVQLGEHIISLLEKNEDHEIEKITEFDIKIFKRDSVKMMK